MSAMDDFMRRARAIDVARPSPIEIVRAYHSGELLQGTNNDVFYLPGGGVVYTPEVFAAMSGVRVVD